MTSFSRKKVWCTRKIFLKSLARKQKKNGTIKPEIFSFLALGRVLIRKDSFNDIGTNNQPSQHFKSLNKKKNLKLLDFLLWEERGTVLLPLQKSQKSRRQSKILKEFLKFLGFFYGRKGGPQRSALKLGTKLPHLKDPKSPEEFRNNQLQVLSPPWTYSGKRCDLGILRKYRVHHLERSSECPKIASKCKSWSCPRSVVFFFQSYSSW